MNRIQKISRFLLIVFNILLVGVPLTTVLTWCFIETSSINNMISQGIFLAPVVTPEGSVNLAYVQWTGFTKMIAIIGEGMGILPFLMSLLSLKVIFSNYKKGHIFTVQNAQNYRRLGLLFFLYALIAKPLSELLMILATTLSNPPGHRYLSLSFGTPNISILFVGLLVMVISWVMVEASRMNEEHQFIV